MTRNTRRLLRCAIYTRKSSEEGLDQEFNSLEAQHEACAAYIKSQGWKAIAERFDDGGHSGGSLERPALQRLMGAVEARQVDVIVIYKIDRLTRSLADFARLADSLDANGVSFVSVTQQFNTTTSMGRLTLNMLLSFAQFEREVTGERIRDKVAASKKKGMWMGGYVPLGYDAIDRKLVINPKEAETVRTIYQLHREHSSVRFVKTEAARLGLTTKKRPGGGRCAGGTPFSRGHLYRILSNPIYAGLIAHKGETYSGRHKAIIERKDWDAVQATLAAHRNGERRPNAIDPSPLVGLLRDAEGVCFTPSHATKAGRRYRYYVERSLITGEGPAKSELRRIPAPEIEGAVRDAVLDLLASPNRVLDAVGDRAGRAAETVNRLVNEAAKRKAQLSSGTVREALSAVRRFLVGVIVGTDKLRLEINQPAFNHWLTKISAKPAPEPRKGDAVFTHEIATRIRKRGTQMKLVLDDTSHAGSGTPDQVLVGLIVLGYELRQQLLSGTATSIQELADSHELPRSYAGRMLRLGFLAPDITAAILEGTHPPELTAETLRRLDRLPVEWADQRRILGFQRD